MAQKVTVLLLDDLDGSEAQETVPFAVDGVAYEIDLTSEHASALRDGLKPFIAAGRRVGGRRPITLPRSMPKAAAHGRSGRHPLDDLSAQDRDAARRWGREHGFSVGDRGRIAREIVQGWKDDGSPA